MELIISGFFLLSTKVDTFSLAPFLPWFLFFVLYYLCLNYQSSSAFLTKT